MLHVFQLGPIELQQGEGWFVAAADEEGPRKVAVKPTLEQALKELVRVLGSDLRVAPDMEALGRKLGLGSAPLPQGVKAMRAHMALSTAHGKFLDPDRPEPLLIFAQAASDFYRAAPWKVWHDEEELQLRVTGSFNHTYSGVIMGGLGEEFGLALYDDPKAVQRISQDPSSGRMLQANSLSVMTDERSDFALGPLREAFGLEVVPFARRLHKGKPKPVTGLEIMTLGLAMDAIALLRPDKLDAKASIALDDGPEMSVEVRIRAPGSKRKETGLEPETVVPLARERGPVGRTGRNEACPCGSGQKYKKCHGLEATAAPSAHLTPKESYELELELMSTPIQTFGKDWFEDACAQFPLVVAFDDDSPYLSTFVPWLVYTFRRPGEPTACQLFIQRSAATASPRQLAYLRSQEGEILSYWEVRRVELDRGLDLIDRLTGREVFVEEKLATHGISVGQGLMGRVATLDGRSSLSGIFPVSLPSHLLSEAVRAVKAELGLGGDAQEVSGRLREPKSSVVLIQRWKEHVDAPRRSGALPRLTNTDGDPLVQVVDRYSFPEDVRSEVLSELQALADDHQVVARGKRDKLAFNKAPSKAKKANVGLESVLWGTARVGPDFLELETNSKKRAAALRKKVLKNLKSRLTLEDRTLETLEEALAKPHRVPPEPSSMSRQEKARFASQWKKDYYREWLDEPIPALKGLTPRQASKKPGSRDDLVKLVDGLEEQEASFPEGERFDVSPMRKELGLLKT